MSAKMSSLILSMCLTLIHSGPILAQAEGRGSGGGSGGKEFAMKNGSEEAMTGRTPGETLINAFEKARGRFPRVIWSEAKPGTLQTGTLLSAKAVTGIYGLAGTYRDEGFRKPNEELVVLRGSYILERKGAVPDMLKNFESGRYPIIRYTNQYADVRGRFAASETGLLFADSEEGNIEFRQSDSRTIVFAISPRGEGRCGEGRWTWITTYKYCYVGYIFDETAE